MRSMLCWGLLSVLLTGCGASAPPLPPTARPNRVAQAPAAQDVSFDKAATPEEDAATQAAHWADRLTEPNEATRRQACQTLAQLGSAGYPYLVKAVQGEAHEVRLLALEALSPMGFQEHSKVLAPLLLQLVQDSDPNMRRLAAERLSWFDRTINLDEVYTGPLIQERLKALRKAAESDKDSGVQATASASATMVQQAIEGKLAQTDARIAGDAPPTEPSNQRPKREIKR